MKNYYSKNIEAIRKLYPGFIKWIENRPKAPWLEIVPADNGMANVRISHGVSSRLAYDKKDPTLAYANIEKGITLQKQWATMIFGFGVGHGLAKLADIAEEGHSFLIVEPTAELYRAAFAEHDFSKLIANRTLLFCPGKSEIDYAISFLEGTKVVANWNVVVDVIAKQHQDYYPLIENGMASINRFLHSTGTVSSHGEEMARNDSITLPYLIRHRGVKELEKLFEKKPAIVVATGPSLARNIHLLQKIHREQSAVIIAVAQALRPLLAYDIRPDFICTVDFGEVNLSHLVGLMDEDVPLVTINKAYAPLVRAYKGPKFISAAVPQGLRDECVLSVLKDRGGLIQGGSVLHTAYGLAVAMHCDPVVLIGVDLALTDASHFNQVDSMGKIRVEGGLIRWDVSDPRSSISKRPGMVMGPVEMTDGYFGEDVMTNSGLMSFLTSLEGYVKMLNNSMTTIDATEGGALIRGTRRMFLSEVMKTYCKKKINKAGLEKLLSFREDADEEVRRATDVMGKETVALKDLKSRAEKALKTADDILRAGNQRRRKAALEDNKRHTIKAFRQAEKIPTLALLVRAAMEKAESREYHVEETGVDALATKNDENLKKRVDRNRVMLEALRDGAIVLLDAHAKSLGLLKKYQDGDRTVLDPVGETEPPDLGDAEEYFAEGNFARPLLEAYRVLKWPDGDKKAAALVVRKALDMRDASLRKAADLQKEDRKSGKDKLPKYLDMVEDGRQAGQALQATATAHEKRSRKVLEELEVVRGKIKAEPKNLKKVDQQLKWLTKETEEGDKIVKDVTAGYLTILQILDAAIKLLPDREEARWGKATTLNYLGDDLKGSEKEYRALIKVAPDNLQYRLELGQVLIRRDKFEDGKALVVDVMGKDPQKFGYFWKALARMHADRNDLLLARNCYNKYIETHPTDDEAVAERNAL